MMTDKDVKLTGVEYEDLAHTAGITLSNMPRRGALVTDGSLIGAFVGLTGRSSMWITWEVASDEVIRLVEFKAMCRGFDSIYHPSL